MEGFTGLACGKGSELKVDEQDLSVAAYEHVVEAHIVVRDPKTVKLGEGIRCTDGQLDTCFERHGRDALAEWFGVARPEQERGRAIDCFKRKGRSWRVRTERGRQHEFVLQAGPKHRRISVRTDAFDDHVSIDRVSGALDQVVRIACKHQRGRRTFGRLVVVRLRRRSRSFVRCHVISGVKR
ncbi:MAG: hypothetical protein MK142_11080 [Pseudomonadales bacterium]|nr:hypothetical protein [Pseudomonadales bacterium]